MSRPFTGWPFAQTSDRDINSVIGKIAALGQDFILKSSTSQLQNHFFENNNWAHLVLKTEEASMSDPVRIEIDVSNDRRRYFSPGTKQVIPGTRVVVTIPFEGDIGLWHANVNPYSFQESPEIEIDRGSSTIYFDIEFSDEFLSKHDKDGQTKILTDKYGKVTRELNVKIHELNEHIDKHNEKLRSAIKNSIQHEKQRAQSIHELLISLPISMKKNDNPPTIPMRRKERPLPSLPSVDTKTYEPELIIEQEEYEYILTVLKNVSFSIERSPSVFSRLKEEDIRDILLVHLNGHYESATGETFNAEGKTDILIRENSKNAFIAECKFWDGPKSLNKAVDQLLSYLTWRDSKCAILVFNKNKRASEVLDKCHEVMEGRPEHVTTVTSHGNEEDARYIFVKEDQPGREITITVQVYDIPCA